MFSDDRYSPDYSPSQQKVADLPHEEKPSKPEGCDCFWREQHDPTNAACALVAKMEFPTDGLVRWERVGMPLRIPEGSTDVKVNWVLEPDHVRMEGMTLFVGVRAIGASWTGPKTED